MVQTQCLHQLFGICFVAPPEIGEGGIFRYSDFITALALLVLVYTFSDARTQFRLAIAPTVFHLYYETFALIALIGVGALGTDLWLAERWPVPVTALITVSIWRAILGLLFLALAMTWIWHAFIRPPIFNRTNYVRYAQELFRIVVRGSPEELPVIAHELRRSAEALLRYSKQDLPPWASEGIERRRRKVGIDDAAYQVLLSLGNRKFCRHVVDSTPVTAIRLFDAAANSGKFQAPLGQFAKNIAAEAIANTDSVLYHEDEGLTSGLTGYLKPFSRAIFGNYEVVEGLGKRFGSPLDIHYEERNKWDAERLKAYCTGVSMTFREYLDRGYWGRHSFALFRAYGDIEGALSDLYTVDGKNGDTYSSGFVRRLDVVLEFIATNVKAIGAKGALPAIGALRRRDNGFGRETFYDHLANMMMQVILRAVSVRVRDYSCWMIQHNMVWEAFFRHTNEGPAWKIVQFKLRRLMYR